MQEELWEITGGGTTDVGVWDSTATGYGEGIICITGGGSSNVGYGLGISALLI